VSDHPLYPKADGRPLWETFESEKNTAELYARPEARLVSPGYGESDRTKALRQMMKEIAAWPPPEFTKGLIESMGIHPRYFSEQLFAKPQIVPVVTLDSLAVAKKEVEKSIFGLGERSVDKVERIHDEVIVGTKKVFKTVEPDQLRLTGHKAMEERLDRVEQLLRDIRAAIKTSPAVQDTLWLNPTTTVCEAIDQEVGAEDEFVLHLQVPIEHIQISFQVTKDGEPIPGTERPVNPEEGD
jgi:hypothetical protein